MARHNPVLGGDKLFQPGGYASFDQAQRGAGYAQAPQHGQTAPSQYGYQGQYVQTEYGYAPQSQQYGQPASTQYGYGNQQQSASPEHGATAEQMEQMFAQPSATAFDTGRMRYEDVMNKSAIVLGIITLVALISGVLPIAFGLVGGEGARGTGSAITTGLMILGAIGGLVLGLVNSFRRTPSPALIMAYAAFEGLALGGISAFFESRYPGIAVQAVLATMAVSVSVLVLFRFGVVRTSPRLNKIFFVALIGYLLFSLANVVLMMFNVVGGDFGLRSGPLGLLIGAIAVLLASYSLVMDFEDIKNGVNNGIPKVFAWRCAFGLAVTLVWMYMEILRILAILRGNN
ncbi:Bax inhibitor-1/YccA family protein [Devriesea agamarum]|uniref:Bax inhibitor-1/YccA family protein n=1 Tax=Devriesea agamarum TaxID=472569 RepID=UPI00071C9B85|nr:Bax inhibitor-1/YccA family protein [Devriesea agamarum]